MAKKHKTLLQDRTLQAITDALRAYYGIITLTVEIKPAESASQASDNEKIMQNEEKKEKNALIEKIMAEFDAKIIKTFMIG